MRTRRSDQLCGHGWNNQAQQRGLPLLEWVSKQNRLGSGEVFTPDRTALDLATEYTEINEKISVPSVFSVAIYMALA